jgi:hypothetical protein
MFAKIKNHLLALTIGCIVAFLLTKPIGVQLAMGIGVAVAIVAERKLNKK